MKPNALDRYLDYDNPDCQLRQILLIAHSLVNRDEHLEGGRGAPEQLSRRSDCELRKIPSEFAGHVLVEQNMFHAI